MNNLKGKAIFVAEVAIALVVIAVFQDRIMQIPVVGQYLPGSKA